MGPPIELHEREVRTFPRDWFVDQEGRSRIFPEVRDLSAFEIKDTAEGVSLRVLGLIGYLPITPDITLNLRPKFPTENLWFMLEQGDETFGTILPTVRAYEQLEQSAPHQMLARSFAHYLRQILSSGFARSYIPERVSGYFRPKVAFGPTIAAAFARGEPAKTISDVFSFTADTRANGLLKTACRHFLGVMPRTGAWQADRRTLSDTLACLVRVPERDMLPVDLTHQHGVPARIRVAYTGALTTYGIFRGFTKVGFEYSPQGASLPSFLFCLDDIFEGFTRNVLRLGLREVGLSVADGNRPRHQRPLFTDNATFPVKPDLIFKRVDEVEAVGEVKYKPKVDEGDRYQLLSHTLALGSSIGLWISPAPTPESEGMQFVGSFAGSAKFWHYRIDLSSNLKASVLKMVAEVSSLISPSLDATAAA
jgi:5-methylcytosine-specific restriction enzyme subunit McrC